MRKLFLLFTITGLTFATGCRLFRDPQSRSCCEGPSLSHPLASGSDHQLPPTIRFAESGAAERAN